MSHGDTGKQARGIIDGKYPPYLTSDKLIYSLTLPINWCEQKLSKHVQK